MLLLQKLMFGVDLSISELCFATFDQSDNTAANLLFDRIGGPAALTDFFRQAGDSVSRSDRLEPELNIFVSNEPFDTTSPLAIATFLRDVLTGNVLPEHAREQLVDWMRPGGVTGNLLRPAVPADWDVADKSGAGNGTRNLIAMLTPPDRLPIFVSLSIADTKADFKTRNEALITLSAAVMEMVAE